jgi:DNA-binding transcriptional regulator YiaG
LIASINFKKGGKIFMANEEVRQAMKKNEVRQWELADRFRVSEVTFHKWLRHEFADDRKGECLRYIEQIIAERRK